jgi:hypothetical protein
MGTEEEMPRKIGKYTRSATNGLRKAQRTRKEELAEALKIEMHLIMGKKIN